MVKNVILDQKLVCLAQFFSRKFFLRVLSLLVARHYSKQDTMQFKEKLINQTRENGKKKLVSGPILAYSAQIRAAKTFFEKSGFVSH